jgi:hypothetical protein
MPISVNKKDVNNRRAVKHSSGSVRWLETMMATATIIRTRIEELSRVADPCDTYYADQLRTILASVLFS